MCVEMANKRMSLKESAFFSIDHQTMSFERRERQTLTPDSSVFPCVLAAMRGSR